MGTLRKAALISGFIAAFFAVPFAQAASSFTYGAFQKLIGSYIQPISTANSYATQLQAPVVIPDASTTPGSLTGGPLQIEVAAISATGTSSPSSEIATTTTPGSALHFTWNAVPGATGYAIYMGTSTPGSEQSYKMATSTSGLPNTNFTLTSTSLPTYYPVPASGAGYLTSVGSTASTTFDTGGYIRSSTTATSTCTATNRGSIVYNPVSDLLWLCKAGGWTVVK